MIEETIHQYLILVYNKFMTEQQVNMEIGGMTVIKKNVVALLESPQNIDEFKFNKAIFDKRDDWDIIVYDNSLLQYSIMGNLDVDRFIIHKGGLINERHIDQWINSGSRFAQSSNILCGQVEYCFEFYRWYMTYHNNITGDDFFDKHIRNHIRQHSISLKDNVIIYSLFGKENLRYTANLNELMVVNNLLYPNYDVIVYIDDKIRNSNTYTTLKRLQDDGLLYIEQVEDKYNDKKLLLTAYRMKEVWNIANNVVAIRDIDSIPNSFEIKSTIYFEYSMYSLSTIRSHKAHWYFNNILYLAGLSNFKPNQIHNIINNITFDEYLSNYEYVWDGDQRLLRKYFGNDKDRTFLSANFIDFVAHGIPYKYKDIPSMTEIDVELINIDQELINVLDKVVKWSGQPIKDSSLLKEYLSSDNEEITIIWCKSDNVGDNITPYIYDKLKNRSYTEYKGYNIIATGSIIEWSNTNSIVWGTGAISNTIKLDKVNPHKIISVRGPLTRDRLLEVGIECPNVYGDPGLILSKIYNPNIEKKYKYGVIPHFIDLNKSIVGKLTSYLSNTKLIRIDHKNVEKFINEILECENLISSSLHGMIIGDSYGVPNVAVKFGNNVTGGQFKFNDYLLSVNRSVDNYLNIIDGNNTFDDIARKLEEYQPIEQSIIDNIYNLCPFL